MTSSTITPASSFRHTATYVAAAVFVAGNLLLPRLFHAVPMGGPTWLPIYFFTLVGAWLYGWRAGVLTALVSPVANALLFGMPLMAALPAIMLKSVLLAIFASLAARRVASAAMVLPALTAVVLAYQCTGTLGEWALTGSLTAAC